MMNYTRRAIIGAGIALAAFAGSGFAREMPKPQGDVILSIEGKVSNVNGEKAADFDLAMIEAMPKTVFKTTTPWIEGVAEFEGVSLKALLDAAGAQGTNLDAVALNDYAAPLPASDADAGAIVAYKVNGEYMSVRDKGPLWIIYPFDQKPELKTETIYSRSVWQLRKIAVKD